MRRLVVILLLVLLPVQFSWASMTSYCESGGTTNHGVHSDDAAVPYADTDSASAEGCAAAAGLLDAGCDHGHCHCVGIPSLATEIPTSARVERRQTQATNAAATPATARPERPQWTRFA